MSKTSKRSMVITLAGMALTLVGAIVYECGVVEGWWAVLVGGLLLFFSRMREHVQNKDNTQARNGRVGAILMFSSGMLCVAAYLMMKEKGYWLLPLMIAAVTELYAGLRMK